MKLIPLSRKVGIPHGDDNASTTQSVPTMTSNTTPSGEASASSEFGSLAAWRAFDGIFNTSTDMWGSNADVNEYLQYEYATAIAINKYIVKHYNPNNATIKDWTLQGSDTGAFSGEEVDLDTITDNGGLGNVAVRTYTFENGTTYKFYRVSVQATNGWAYIELCELVLVESQ